MSAHRLVACATAASLALLTAGCGISDPYNKPGATASASTTAAATTARPATTAPPTPIAAGGVATTPEQALSAVALAWGNWTSATVHAQHLRAIELVAGPAVQKLKVENRQLEDGVISSPQHLHATATVAAVSVKGGADHRDAIVVTREHMSGLGALGSTGEYIVTLATVQRHGAGWVVTRWDRQS